MTADPTAELRRAFYLLVGLAAVGVAAARVCGTELAHEPSRYATPPGGGYVRAAEHRVLRPWPEKRPAQSHRSTHKADRTPGNTFPAK